MKLSYVITAKSLEDEKLRDLLKSIDDQDFPKEQREILVVTEGTSESAKAIGIRRAQGDIVCILASDNYLDDKYLTHRAMYLLDTFPIQGCYPGYYSRVPKDSLLNRYFALIGGNDPLAIGLGKADRLPLDKYEETEILSFDREVPTLGDNGFFVRREDILKADLYHYYHIDVCEDLRRQGLHQYARISSSIWHRTGECSILSFFRRRARFGTQHAFNPDRRWHLVGPKDIPRLLWFIVSSTTLVIPLIRAIRGYTKVKDVAWFLHPVMSILTVLTYGIVVISLVIKRLKSLLLSVLMGGQKA